MSENAKPTPGKWLVDSVNREYFAVEIDGVYNYIGTINPASFSTDRPSYETQSANAAHIVKCVNEREALLVTLEWFVSRHNGGVAEDPHIALARSVLVKARS